MIHKSKKDVPRVVKRKPTPMRSSRRSKEARAKLRKAVEAIYPNVVLHEGYNQEYNNLAYKLCLMGATNADLGDFFERSERQIEKWMQRYPEFGQAVRAGRVNADAEVAHSLFKRATGFTLPAKKIMQHEGEPVIVDYDEHYPGDVTAQQFWLKNRRPDQWRDRSQHEVFGKGGGAINVAISNVDAKL